jgi:YidC/Oxa1 family membrane protein insertase
MPQKPNTLLRVIVPIVLALGGLGIGWAVFTNTSRQGTTPPTPAPGSIPAAKPTPAAPTDAPAQTPTDGSASAPAPAQPAPAPAPAATGLKAQLFPKVAFTPLGSLEPASQFQMQLTPSAFGAGVESLSLTNHYTTIYETAHEQLQAFHPNIAAPTTGVAPLAVVGVEIDGQMVRLGSAPSEAQSFWRETAPGVLEAVILDAADAPVARVVREYQLQTGTYDVIVRQRVENLRPAPVKARWFQFGPVDLPPGSDRPDRDKRRVRFGYLNSPQIDPSRQIVDASRFLIERRSAMGRAVVDPATGIHNWPGMPLWPNEISGERDFTLSWVGLTSRHFCVILHPLVDPAATNGDKSFRLGAAVHSMVLPGMKDDGGDAVLSVTLESGVVEVPASGSASLDVGMYAGPESKQYLSAKAEPRAGAVSLSKIVVYTLGGPCGFCTFQSITGLLHWWLVILHNYVLFDYALGIILLVVCMRSILHPVTRHAQISMQRFSKQMQALAPKQKKIQERYADDPQKMREELARLMREEHISYSSAAKGCLTPFLQTPVWIALYAMLFFMFELRHEAAFFGVFQWLSQATLGMKWTFLADLSEPDRFIPFGTSFNIPLMGKVDSFNVLPVILGVVFFVQQKYLTPPATTPLTPEQEQQQKIMKIMMVVLFPLLMYTQPAALTLYFVVNSSLGIVESRYIRRHAEKMDLLKPTTPPPGSAGPGRGKGPGDAPRKPGFFARLQAVAEAKQRELEQRQREQQRKKKK